MNKLGNFDSDELFDPSSNDSGEEFVPVSCEVSSESTDQSSPSESGIQKSLLFKRFRNKKTHVHQ